MIFITARSKNYKLSGALSVIPDQLFATPDHSVPTTAKKLTDIPLGEMRDTVAGLQEAAERIGFTHFDMADPRHGIVHVVGPEQGITCRA